MENLAPQNYLIERLYWIIKLRWIASLGVFLTVLFAHQILKLSLQIFPLYTIALLLGIYNLVFSLLLTYQKKSLITINRIANSQISLDLLSLAVLIHFSGGIENPFILYFVFHMVIAGILLSRRASFLQATFAVFLFFIMVISEYFGILQHYCLKGFITHTLHDNPRYIAGVSFVFISTVYIAVYMATSISSRLREREKSLKETNKLLVEKDHIKSEYVLRVTHDIKEHLAAIQSCIEPVTGGITGPLNERQINLLQRADERTGKLLFFVKALLEITRIKLSKELNLEYFSFKDMLSEVFAHISFKARDKYISINSTVEPSIGKINGYKDPVYTIGIIAKSLKVCPATVRIWERKGLTKPKRLGKNGFYSKCDMDRLEYIKELLQKNMLT